MPPNPVPYDWIDIFLLVPVLRVHSDSALIGVVDPNFFSNAGLKYDYVRRPDGFNDLPKVRQLSKYDIKEGDRLWMRLGRSDKTVSAAVNSLCYDWFNIRDYYEKGFASVVSCHVALDTTTLLQGGDSDSPVYALEGRRGADFVRAYGVVSAREAVCIPGINYCTLGAVVAPIDWMYVKLS